MRYTICPWAARNCSTPISSRGSRSPIPWKRHWFLSGYAKPGDPGPGKVAEREYAHLDLILRLPNLHLVVVENKVWSLPDDAQLEAYAADPIRLLGTDTAQILLSLTPPAWQDSGSRVLGGAAGTG